MARRPERNNGHIWKHFKDTGDKAARNYLIEDYLPLVRYVAGKIKQTLPASVEHQDLVSYGLFGLVDAIEKFDLERGIKFETYAINRIRGAIIDELRSIDWVPRSVRSKARDIDRAVVDLENKLHRSPTDTEIAERLDISSSDLRETYSQLHRTQVTALEELTLNQHDDNLTLLDTVTDYTAPDPEEVLMVQELVTLLARGVSKLPRSEMVVLYLYYVAQKTLAEISKELGVTESQIYHLRSSSLNNLRESLSAG